MKNVEILAPGGSKEGIYAAVYSGADAVYTGINRFSARAFADNPTVEEMCEILDFAHLHDKKIYLTANTLLTEDELEGSFYSQIRPLYEAGLDAVIVQDFGVMDFVREHFPGLDIHASTQMSILTGEAAELLTLLDTLWMAPTIFPATREEVLHKFRCAGEIFANLGVPLIDEEMLELADKYFQLLPPELL